LSATAIHHVQVAMPRGEEDRGRTFYADLLGLIEIPKAASLAERGGLWFRIGALELHLGVEDDFRPAKKAHPGLLVDDLQDLVARLEAAGYATRPDHLLEGYDRAYVNDPFGNRIELLQPRR
jgi:catechol 2,3-dioxygenase-like lactoylglutathione lyase family enzyme